MRATLVLALALLLPGALSAKQPFVDIEKRLSAEQLQATGLDTLSSAQLALLNKLLQQDVSDAVQASQAEARSEYGTSSLIGLNDEPIHSRVKGTITSWEPGTEFVLENGQRVSVQNHWHSGSAAEREFLRTVQRSACKRFGTVLGPDYNYAHRDHLHLEVSGSSFCR